MPQVDDVVSWHDGNSEPHDAVVVQTDYTYFTGEYQNGQPVNVTGLLVHVLDGDFWSACVEGTGPGQWSVKANG